MIKPTKAENATAAKKSAKKVVVTIKNAEKKSIANNSEKTVDKVTEPVKKSKATEKSSPEAVAVDQKNLIKE